MNRTLLANLRKLGFTHGEIEAIAREMKENQQREEYKKEAKSRKANSALVLAQKRYYARKRAAQTGTPIPAWARKRTSS